MSFRFVIGLPGSGKSLFMVHRVVETLLHESRPIVTTLPLFLAIPEGSRQDDRGDWWLPGEGSRRVETLQRYMWRKHKWPPLVGEGGVYSDAELLALPGGVGERVRVLEMGEESKEFFRFRGWVKGRGWVVMPPIKDKRDGAVDFSGSPGGVVYIMDEVHRDYPARRWQEHGLSLLFYVAEHRKLTDDLWFLSNSPGQVDKQCKEVVEDWFVLRDRRKRFLGPLRLADNLEYGVFPHQPTRQDQPLQTGSVEVDGKGLAATYDTARGSVQGLAGADTGRKLRGLSPKWIWAGGLVLACALWAAPKVISSAATQISGGLAGGISAMAGKGATTAAGGAVPASVPAALPAVLPASTSAVVFPVTAAGDAGAVYGAGRGAGGSDAGAGLPERLRLVGVAPAGRQCLGRMVMLSDGRVLTLGQDAELSAVGWSWAVVSGERVTF